MGKIFYVHGLGGGVKSSTYIGLCKYFYDVEILEYPSETATFDENFKIICDKFFDKVGSEIFWIIGTSLGGYFASKLADEFLVRGGDVQKIRLMLINPAVNPYEIARGLNYPEALVNSYKGIEISKNLEAKPIVVLAMDDELLDANATAERFSDCDVLAFPSGGHSCWDALGDDIIKIVEKHS